MRWNTNVYKVQILKHRRRRFLPMAKARGFRAENAMSNVNIEIFNIGRTEADREQVRKWLDHLGADGYAIPEEGMVSDPALLVALASKRCYLSFEPGLNPNVTKVRSDLAEYLDNILKSGHGSVLEHSVYTFAIEGVSRVFTGEMNRHRAGWPVSEGSIRYIRMHDDICWWLPASLQPDMSKPIGDGLEDRKFRSRQVFNRAFKQMAENCAELLDIWKMDEGNRDFKYKKRVTSCLRRVIGMGVATGGVWTGNLRALRHVIALRADEPAAEEEIFHVFSRIGKIMMEREPAIFGDFSADEHGSIVPKYRKV
jgi:thymidylate synthase (FAD)